MATSQEHAVKALNSLIETTLDSVGGYREAAENVEAPQLRTLFEKNAADRLRLAQELQAEVRSFGGEPEDDQSAIGRLHNKFVDVKAALTGGGEKAIVNEVERGEDVIKAKFQKALEDDDLPTEARAVISRAYAEVKAGHDEISRIKHQLQ
jgi:uncharacterized protein (TIGR02284 family)